MTKLKKSYLLLFLFFFLSRLFIYLTPPPTYSDVRMDYERYAHMWKQGHWPYLKHNYEYPPASVPILYFPLFLYHNNIGDYYKNYRAQILVVDIAFFAFLILSLNRLSWSEKKKLTSLSIYILLTTFTRAFLYEGIDLIFTGLILASYFTFVWFKENNMLGKYLRWLLFWLSTSVKFLTLPLMVPLFLVSTLSVSPSLVSILPKKSKTKPLPPTLQLQLTQLFKNKDFTQNSKKELTVFIITFLLIWGIPAAVFQSSLLVSFKFNFARPLKYGSFPAYIIQATNYFTHSEQRSTFKPDYEWQGPVANKVTEINKYSFPTIMLIYLLWTSSAVIKYAPSSKKAANTTNADTTTTQSEQKFFLLLKIHAVYLFTLFLSAKTFSQPFHIWYLPVIALLAVGGKWWKKYLMVFAAMIMLVLDMTTLFHFQAVDTWGYYLKTVIRDGFRFLPMMILLLMIIRLKPQKNKESALC